MSEQLVITLSREFGSAGHEIAERIAKDLGIKFYDRSMLDEIAGQMDVNIEVLEKYDETPRNRILSRRVGKYSNSMEEILAETQFDFIRDKAESGESFVIVGRCSETVLQDVEGMISIFVNGDRECKVKRVMEKYGLSREDAFKKMERHDFKRRRYHNRHSEHKWGDSRFYDICINSSPLGVSGTVKVLEHYIEERKSVRPQ